MEENHVCFIDVPQSHSNTSSDKSRSVSPMTPSPRYEKNLGFFHALSRRFGRRSQDDIIYHDSRSSSTDSCSSTTGHLQQFIIRKDSSSQTVTTLHNSTFELSCNSSETSGSIDDCIDKTQLPTVNRLHRRSTSSIRRALKTLSISTRSLSCNGTPSKELKSKKNNNNFSTNSKNKNQQQQQQQQPQRILRQPVSYTYLKGMSGLPTQRVPRSSVCCHYTRR